MLRPIVSILLVGGLATIFAIAVRAEGPYFAPAVEGADSTANGPAAVPPRTPLDSRFQQLEQRVHALEMKRLPAVSQPSYFGQFTSGGSVTDDLEALGKEVTEQGAALEEIEGDLAGVAKDVKKKVDPGNSGGPMKVSGRVHFDTWSFIDDSPAVNLLETGNAAMPPQDRFGFRRLRFGVSGNLADILRYKIEMEFAGGNNPELRDAYLGWTNLPVLQTVLLGNQKRPYGLDHLNSSRFNVFLERPFIIEAFNQDSRRLGIQSYGVSDDEVFNWRYGVFNLENVQSIGNYSNNDYQLEVAGRLASTYWYDEASDGRGYAHVAVAGTSAWPDGTAINMGTIFNEARFRTRPEARSMNRWLDTGRIAGANNYEMLAFEKVVNLGPLQIVGEYQNLWLRRDTGFGNSRNLHFHGGYVYAAYFLTGEHMTWERDSGTLGRVSPFENFFLVNRARGGIGGGWGAWQIAFRYSYADLTDHDIAGGIGQSYTVGMNWWWSPYGRMQFNYIDGYLEQKAYGNGLVAGNYDIIGTRFMVDF